ncbi:MAG: HD domain-containing phosphohydrolase [Bacillota bacterium]
MPGELNPLSCLDETARQLENFVAIGIALSAEKDRNRLLEAIITEARRITNADAGTLYLVEEDHLKIKIIQNESMNTFLGGKGEEINIPPVPITHEYVSGYVAATSKSVNIPDVYEAEGFDFSGPRKYDSMTGYRTTSMLVIPLRNHYEEVIGVLQLINALDEHKKVIPFDPGYQTVIEALSSLAAIALTNMQLIQEIENLFESFVQVMVTAIDARTPYNATHTQKVTLYAQILAEEINNNNKDGPFAGVFFDKDRIKQLTMAAWLHDIGKITTPLEVMNKATRLDAHLNIVLIRLDYAMQRVAGDSLKRQLALWREGRDSEAREEEEKLQEKLARLREARELIIKADNPGTFIDRELSGKLEAIASITYVDEAGETVPLLDTEELGSLTIPKGTLTDAERKIMEDHVVVTERMLAKMPFTRQMAPVPLFACMHHEHLDGKGYPYHLHDTEIPLEARILAIADIFDALTASDRPYKKGMPPDKALQIMGYMVKDGKLDSELMELFARGKLWEKISVPVT